MVMEETDVAEYPKELPHSRMMDIERLPGGRK
jgi:hypothetical protein